MVLRTAVYACPERSVVQPAQIGIEPVVSAISPIITPSVFDKREMLPPDKAVAASYSFDEILNVASSEAQKRGLPPPANGIFYVPEYSVLGVGFGKEHSAGLVYIRLGYGNDSGYPLGNRSRDMA